MRDGVLYTYNPSPKLKGIRTKHGPPYIIAGARGLRNDVTGPLPLHPSLPELNFQVGVIRASVLLFQLQFDIPLKDQEHVDPFL